MLQPSYEYIHSGDLGGQYVHFDGDLPHYDVISPEEHLTQWIQDNLQEDDGTVLFRNNLYHIYCQHCADHGSGPVNLYLFDHEVRRQFPQVISHHASTRQTFYRNMGISPASICDQQYVALTNDMPFRCTPPVNAAWTGENAVRTLDGIRQSERFVALLPDTAMSNDPGRGDLAAVFQQSYQQHIDTVVNKTYECTFSELGGLWVGYWQNLDRRIVTLFDDPYMRHYVAACDDIMYNVCGPNRAQSLTSGVLKSSNTIAEIMVPDVTMPLDNALTVTIRQLADSMDASITKAMQGYAEPVASCRIRMARDFAACLRGQTSLNHLCHAARTVLKDPQILSQMLLDWNRIDHNDIQSQAFWVFEEHGIHLVSKICNGISDLLEARPVLEDYLDWVESLLQDHCTVGQLMALSSDLIGKFMIQWSYITSLVTRDLTLRSAQSFGHFHLLRLFLDEYIMYRAEGEKRRERTDQLRIQLNEAIF